jgi:hypothetical protein
MKIIFKIQYIIIVFLFIGLGCGNRQSKNDKRNNIGRSDSTISISKPVSSDSGLISFSPTKGIIFTGTLSDSFDNIDVFYTNLRISIFGKTVFVDTSSTEYFLSSIHPHYRKLSNDHHEIMVLVSNRPQKDYVFYIVSDGNSILNSRKIASVSISSPKKHDAVPDIIKFNGNHFTNIFDNSESLCGDCDSSFYNPFLSYFVSDSGISLDTPYTINVNKKYYGDFYGFEYNDKLHLKIESTLFDSLISHN